MISSKPPPLPSQPAAAPGNSTGHLRGFSNAYLLLFLLDGYVHLADVLFSGTHNLVWLPLLKSVSALFVGVLALVLIMFLGSYRQFPWRDLLPALLVSVWSGFFYLPLPGLLEWKNIEFLGAILSLLVGAITFLLIRFRHKAWLLPQTAFENCSFSWMFTLKVAAFETVVLLPASIVYVVVSCACMVDWVSNGFLHLRPHGLTTEIRTYELAGKTVYLLPTVHIASDSFYKELARGLPKENTTLLPEGVTDRTSRMKTHLSYTAAAKSAGLSEQPDLAHDLPGLVRHFDADIMESTQALLNGVAKGFAQWENQDITGAMATMSNLPPANLQQLKADILDLRNNKIVAGIAESLRGSNNVLVPWGAAHMPGIERELLKFQLKKTSSREITVLEWRKLKSTLTPKP